MLRRKKSKTKVPQEQPVTPEPPVAGDPRCLTGAAAAVVAAYEADPFILGGDSPHAHQTAELPSPARRQARRVLAAAIVKLREAVLECKED